MKRFNMKWAFVILCAWWMTGFVYPDASHAEDCDEWVAKVVSVQGDVQAKKTGTTQWTSVRLNDTFCPGDMLRIQPRSRAAVVLSNESVTRLDQNTTITFTGVAEKKVSLIDILKGAAHFFSRVPRSLKVSTPFVNGAVEGTEFYVAVGDDHTLISVFRGRVAAANDAGSLALGSGQSAVARSGRAPEARVVAKPRDAVRWAIYYPAVMDYKASDFEGSIDTWQGKVRRSIGYYREGDLVNAFSSLDGVPGDIRDSRFYTYRAGLLLTVGRVAEANSDINQALDLDAGDGNALALQSVTAVSQNRKEEALVLANKAVGKDPDSSAPRVALSYAQQAAFNVEGALESLKEAVERSPEDALVRARLSELYMSVGDLDRAFEEARQAATLNPNLARTQTVLGFAYLVQIKTKDAMDAFEKAIDLDQAAPLPRLGLGLTMIREGDLKPGRAELEIAAGLDPNNSLIRSYLGKAFFDEKRDMQSNSQLAVAKELDPMDPTPWFYDAIRKQTLNRPVEALHDLQKSIALNDNRAVYRSKLLLDEDLAARSASLGRIYNDLGFQELALNEGYKSLNADPSSYSAHRLLADSYAARPRHEIARVSELLQSQLLQPINITPVQPSLAESNLLILEGTGPSGISFNEFNPLFLRNRLTLQASGVVGGNSIYGDEVVHSGVWGRVSYSIGQFHYQTDGFRDNNDLDEDIYNVFVQTALSHKTSVQVEYRYKDVEYGDLPFRFDPDNFTPTERTDIDRHILRVGFRHNFSIHSDLLGSFIYADGPATVESSADFGISVGTLTYENDAKGYLAELQHLYRKDCLHFITGIGHANRKFDIDVARIYNPEFPPFLVNSFSSERDRLHQTNFYVYSLIRYPENITWTIGGSADFFDEEDLEEDQFNPKFGVSWTLNPKTTIRAVAFRTLTRWTETNQTLEPTQVSGFNQFFYEAGAVDSWRYGMAIDQIFNDHMNGGLEYSERDSEVPYEDLMTMSFRTADWEERLLRAYFFMTHSTCLATGAEFQYERFTKDPEMVGLEQFTRIETYRGSLGTSFFHPCGFNARLKVSYIDQEGKFGIPLFTLQRGEDDFFVVDASASYRLPKRFGIISFEVRNLFDKKFQFQDTDPSNPSVSPESLVLLRFTLAF